MSPLTTLQAHTRDARLAAGGSHVMKIATYNVNGVNARLPVLLRWLAESRPDAVLHVGLAGGRGIPPGTLVLGSEALYCDLHADVHVARRTFPDAELLAAAREALPGALVQPIGTSATVGGTTGCDVEAMEGFAVLRAAELAGVAAVELRAVSNDIGEADRSRWYFEDGLAALEASLPGLLARLSER